MKPGSIAKGAETNDSEAKTDHVGPKNTHPNPKWVTTNAPRKAREHRTAQGAKTTYMCSANKTHRTKPGLTTQETKTTHSGAKTFHSAAKTPHTDPKSNALGAKTLQRNQNALH